MHTITFVDENNLNTPSFMIGEWFHHQFLIFLKRKFIFKVAFVTNKHKQQK